MTQHATANSTNHLILAEARTTLPASLCACIEHALDHFADRALADLKRTAQEWQSVLNGNAVRGGSLILAHRPILPVSPGACLERAQDNFGVRAEAHLRQRGTWSENLAPLILAHVDMVRDSLHRICDDVLRASSLDEIVGLFQTHEDMIDFFPYPCLSLSADDLALIDQRTLRLDVVDERAATFYRGKNNRVCSAFIGETKHQLYMFRNIPDISYEGVKHAAAEKLWKIYHPGESTPPTFCRIKFINHQDLSFLPPTVYLFRDKRMTYEVRIDLDSRLTLRAEPRLP